MRRRTTWTLLGIGWLFLLHAFPAQAQVSALGKGWLLDSAGSVTSTPGEVILGRNSIKGSYSGLDSGIAKPFLNTNPTFIRFSPNETYTIALNYRIITTGSQGFAFGFFSSTADGQRRFLPTSVITGAAGASGTATLTSRLESYTDVRAGFTVAGTGAIAIDDIRITNSAGQLISSENAEGPAIASGPLHFQLTDAIALLPEANAVVRSAAVADLDGDGYPETILTLTAPNPSTTSLPPIVVEASARMKLATADFFPAGAPTVKHSPVTLFADINNDGLQDILFAEAGWDGPGMFPGSVIGIALNVGAGKYRNVSSLVPADLQTTRSYALAVGDIDGDGRVEIVLPDEDNGSNTALLRWNGTGFDAQRNWIAPSLWKSPANLVHHSWMVVDDFDKDGRQDLLVGSAPIPGTPNLRLLFGAAGGYTAAGLFQLPDGLFGHAPSSNVPVAQTVDVGPVVVTDFNNDGLPDIFAAEEQVVTYQPGVITDTNEPGYDDIRANGGIVFADVGIQVLMNQGSRSFADVTSSSSAQNLGRRHYFSLIAVDMNNDGFPDVVGLYSTDSYGNAKEGQWGTTLFLNDGTGAFQVVDGAQLLASVTTTPSNGQQWNLGAFVPTVVNPQRTEGVVFEPVGGCGVGFCAAAGVNLYKAVANRSIGTGPGFGDSAKLGVPGFNEFYYLRHHADAEAAVRSGQYANGLAHYRAVGKTAGYTISAPNARSSGFPFSLADRGSISRTGTETSNLVTTGYARLQPDQGSTTPAGLVIYGFHPADYLVSETAVPATLPVQSGRIYAEVNPSVTTGLAMANPNDQPATVDFYYTDATGASSGGSITLAPKTQFANFLDQAPLKRFNGSTFEGTFSYSSSVPVAAMAIRGVFNERSDFLMSTLPVVDLSAPLQTGTVVIPHFADGGGWTTQILLVNPSNVPVSGLVQFRDPTGSFTLVRLENQATGEYLIPPRSSRKLTTTGSGPTKTGSVRIIPTGGSTAPSALIVFSYKPGSITVSQAGVTAVRGKALRMYAESAGIASHSGKIQTGLAVANNGSTPITITFELFNRDGSTTGLPAPSSMTLVPFGQAAMFSSDIFSETLPDPFSGVLRITTPSPDGVSVVGLRSHYNENVDFLITTTPPTDEDAPTDALERIFPQLAVGGGYTTQFVLVSGKKGQSSTGTVWLLSGSGAALYIPVN